MGCSSPPASPGTEAARMAAYAALQEQLAKGRYVLPIAFADESIVVRDTLEGPGHPAGRRARRTDSGMC